MRELLFGLALGLGLGAIYQRAGLTAPSRVRRAAALRPCPLLVTLLSALGSSLLLTAFLGYLAVLDVDHLATPPLGAAVLRGAALMGAALGLTGYAPGSLLAALGGGAAVPALCGLAGALAGAVAWRFMGAAVNGLLANLFPPLEGTAFRTTLHAGYVLPGGFLAHGAVGALLLAGAALLRRPDEPTAGEHLLPPEVVAAETAAQTPPTPEDAAAQTLVAALPQEEPLTLDTAPVALPDAPGESPAGETPPDPAAASAPGAEGAADPSPKADAAGEGKSPPKENAAEAGEPPAQDPPKAEPPAAPDD